MCKLNPYPRLGRFRGDKNLSTWDNPPYMDLLSICVSYNVLPIRMEAIFGHISSLILKVIKTHKIIWGPFLDVHRFPPVAVLHCAPARADSSVTRWVPAPARPASSTNTRNASRCPGSLTRLLTSPAANASCLPTWRRRCNTGRGWWYRIYSQQVKSIYSYSRKKPIIIYYCNIPKGNTVMAARLRMDYIHLIT